VLEERDVDALLALTSPHGGTLELVMANEALETHMVRTVRLLVAPRGADHHVYRAGESFFEVGNHAPPVNCSSAGGKCAELVAALDGQEYLSSADGENLATREVLELSFESPGGQPGLVIVARNSLMNTFLFYQGLAYMGRKAGEWTARLERGEEWIRRAIVGMDQLLGRINVSVLQPDGSWQSAGFFDEVGPLAREGQLIQLPGEVQQGDSIHIRLDMTQGYWRVDHLAVVPMLSQVVPQPVEIDTVLRDGKPDREARRRLLDPELHLMTMPGDAYTLQFKIPPGPADYLLESTGFYYEWIREQWLEEEDPIAAMRFLLDPEGTLRRLAPRYQEVEDEMEEIFWNSRVGVNL
jgi:hypothetical protein